MSCTTAQQTAILNYITTTEVRLQVCWPDVDGSLHTFYFLESEVVT
jgi:hypothetical protein